MGEAPKLLDRVRHSVRTPAAISRFLTFLAVGQHVSASTQNQALSALLFLYKDVPAMSIGDIPPIVRARTPERLRWC